MGNEVSKAAMGGALAGVAALKANLRKVRDALPTAGGVGYLRFLTDGAWVFGQDNKELDAFDAKKDRSAKNAGDEVAFNPLSIRVGFTCWTDYPAAEKRKNEHIDDVLVPLGADLPMKHELRDTGWPWKEMIVLDGVVMTGKHKGQPVQYSASSKGGLAAAHGLIDAIMAQLDVSEVDIVPVVELGADHYPHKQWGKTYTPVLDIVEFISMAGMAQDAAPQAEPEPEPEPEPAPARRRVAAQPEPEPEPEVEEPAPMTAVRRRR